MARLETDHKRLTKVLDVLETTLSGEVDDDINWEVVADIIRYLQEYPDTVHHPVEDELFDRVMDKGLTPAERELIHKNLAQHEEIIGATTRLAQDVAQIMNDIIVPVAQLQDHFRSYLDLQRVHMRNEVAHLFPLAERQLEESDWVEIADLLSTQADPLFEANAIDANAEEFTALYAFITQATPPQD